MSLEFVPLALPSDRDRLVAFLCDDEWPFHGCRRPTPHDVAGMEFATADTASHWIVERGHGEVGLIRLLELGDIGDGAPRFDVRVASGHRGRGIGTAATRWVADHLFATYPELHRIEATTRSDNVAMQRALTRVGFTHEGTLRQAWRSDDRWFDALVFAILRTD